MTFAYVVNKMGEGTPDGLGTERTKAYTKAAFFCADAWAVLGSPPRRHQCSHRHERQPVAKPFRRILQAAARRRESVDQSCSYVRSRDPISSLPDRKSLYVQAPPPPAVVSEQILVAHGERFVVSEHRRRDGHHVLSYDRPINPPTPGMASAALARQHPRGCVTLRQG
jgi:hypothetical protein